MSSAGEDATFLVLNGSHLKKMAMAEDIAAAAGVSTEVAREQLAAAVERGWAIAVDDRYSGVTRGSENPSGR